MGFGGRGCADGSEPRRNFCTWQSAARSGSQAAAGGNYRQGPAAFGLRRDYSQETEIFELCANCIFVGENGRAGGQAVSADRSGSGGTEKENFHSGIKSWVEFYI